MPGVVGAVPVIRDVRAVRGVGALMSDFFGVSGTSFLRGVRLVVDVEPFVAANTLGRLPAVTNG